MQYETTTIYNTAGLRLDISLARITEKTKYLVVNYFLKTAYCTILDWSSEFKRRIEMSVSEKLIMLVITDGEGQSLTMLVTQSVNWFSLIMELFSKQLWEEVMYFCQLAIHL